MHMGSTFTDVHHIFYEVNFLMVIFCSFYVLITHVLISWQCTRAWFTKVPK